MGGMAKNKTKSRARSTPQMSEAEALEILAAPIVGCDYWKRLQAYSVVREVWTLEQCMLMCQMEVEAATGKKDSGMRLSWGRELNSLRKALLNKEIEDNKLQVQSTVVEPAD